jgi:hypothetical protein
MSITFAVIILPLWVAISQWILLFALGFFVFVAYRQLGYMLRLKDIGSERDGLAIGEEAPAFAHLPAHHNGDQHTPSEMRFDPHGQWSLLLFADPGCASCQTAVVALEHLAPTLPGTNILVATTAEPTLIEAVEPFRDASIPISRVDREVSNKMYRTLTTPFAYVIDPIGIIRAKGIAGDERTLHKLVQKADQRQRVHVVSSVS